MLWVITQIYYLQAAIRNQILSAENCDKEYQILKEKTVENEHNQIKNILA